VYSTTFFANLYLRLLLRIRTENYMKEMASYKERRKEKKLVSYCYLSVGIHTL
jgi:hypothetical protein